MELERVDPTLRDAIASMRGVGVDRRPGRMIGRVESIAADPDIARAHRAAAQAWLLART